MSAHLKLLYNYLSLHVGSGEDVKDLVQETMLSVWNGIRTFDGRSAFQTWVLGIARRKIADYYRSAVRRATVPLADYEDTLAAEDEFDRIHSKLTVERALAVLTKAEKEIVFLVFGAGRSYAEISEVTGIPVGTIKSRMAGIKAKLGRQLQNEEKA